MGQITAFPTQVIGMPPLDLPFAAAAVETRLRDNNEERATAAATRLRCSDANACDRKLAFASLHIPKDVTYDAQSLLNFASGDWYHQVVQEALVQNFDARNEYRIDWQPRLSLSGHCDSKYGTKGYVVDGEESSEPGAPHPLTAVEIKSMGGYAFDYAVGNKKKSEGPGPKLDHLLQAGLYGMAPQIDADRVHIIYVNRDRNTTAEWIIGLDDPLPHLKSDLDDGQVMIPTIRVLVENEIDRLADILKLIDEGTLPARNVPGYGLVKGSPPEPDSRNDPWNCRYCPYQPRCKTLPAQAVPGWTEAFMTDVYPTNTEPMKGADECTIECAVERPLAEEKRGTSF